MEEKKRVEPMVIAFENGDEYTLEFNRNTVVMAERSGFTREAAGEKMMTLLPDLFFFAFKMHHPSIKREKTDDILFNCMKGLTSDEITRLIELYDEPYKTLINVSDDEEITRKNSGLTVRL